MVYTVNLILCIINNYKIIYTNYFNMYTRVVQ